MAKTILITCLLILFLPLKFHAIAGETINFISLVPGEGQLRDKFISTAARIENGWNHKVNVKLLIDGQVGTEETMVSTVRRGRAQISLLTTAGTSAAIPEMSLLMAPFLFESFEEADFILDYFIKEKVAQMFKNKNLHFIQWIDSGWFNVFAKFPIHEPNDLKNIRMRAAGGPAARLFFQTVEADVAQLPFADLITGLQTGLISGGATNTAMYRTIALYDIAPYITLTRHSLNPGAVFANSPWFESQPLKHKEILKSGIAPTPIVRSDVRNEGREALKFSASKGATIISINDSQRQQWKKKAAASHKLLIEEIGGEAAELYALIQDGKLSFKSVLP